MPQLYSLEASIAEFFEDNSTVTREACDSIASALIGDLVLPVPIQGAWSYTVTAGEAQERIVQFRAQDSTLDGERLELARQIHPEFVPAIEYHGDTGGVKPLFIYTMDKVPGVPHVIANSDKKSNELRINSVQDFARFFAQAWNSPQSISSVESDNMEIQLQQKLDTLLATLPARFHPTLSLLREQYLALLFKKDHPIVLAHGDLCALNVLVDPESLHITGIIDWADAELAPFGLALYGICNILGVMNSTGWHYHPNYQDMVAEFWAILEHEVGPLSDAKRDVIRAACTIGIFLVNGFVWDGQDKTTPVREDGDSVAYLDSWLGVESSANDLLLSSKHTKSR